ncbi:MAG: Cof-type HAD-IIB family hydrolase [Anaerocolumna sp.]
MIDNLNFSNIKLVAIDMDGTALNSNHSLSPRTIAAVRDVNTNKKDVKVIFATGRMLGAVKKHLQDAGMDELVVAHNGALLVDLKNDIIYRDARVAPEVVCAAYAYAKSNNIILHYNLKEQVLVERKMPLSLKYANELGIELQEFDNLSKYDELPTSILLLGRKAELEKVLLHFKSLNLINMSKVFIPWFDDYWMLQFLPFDSSKGKAVMELAHHLGLKNSQVLSFGDSYNDMEMISESGIGIAMGNACEQLKKVADFVTLSNDEDGVAVILEEFIKL